MFLLSIFGLIYLKGLVKVIICLQIIIFSGIINFLGFSFILYQGSFWDKNFLILSLAIIYLFLFSIIFYAYYKTKDNEIFVYFKNLKFFEIDRSAWWGEDSL